MQKKIKEIRAILFDVDDTLYDQRASFCDAYQAIFGDKYKVSGEEVFVADRRHNEAIFRQVQDGIITMDEMYLYRIKEALREFAIEISDETAWKFKEKYIYNQHHVSMTPVIEEMLAFCSGKVSVGIITNGPAEHQRSKMECLEVSRWVSKNHIFISGAVGVTKPDAGIFRKAEEVMDLKPETTLYVGDSFENDIVGAKNAGWSAFWMNRRRKPLPDMGILPDYEVETEEEMFSLLKKIL